MKKIILSLLLFSAMLTHAQTDSLNSKMNLPDSPGFGIANGKLISNQIGAAGGKIVSDDGRVELIFPAGALTTNTTIAIQL